MSCFLEILMRAIMLSAMCLVATSAGPLQCSAQDQLSIERFLGLADEDRSTYFMEALRERAKLLSNLRVLYSMTQTRGVWDDEEIKKIVFVGGRNEVEFRQIGDSNLLRVRHTLGEEADPLYEAWTHYDSATAVCRNMANHREEAQSHARICPKRDSIEKLNTYAYFLTGNVCENMRSHIEFLRKFDEVQADEEFLKRSDCSLRFEQDTANPNLIVAITTFTEKESKAAYRETRHHWVDLEKGFLFTKVVEAHGHVVKGEYHPIATRQFIVRESKEVDDVWLPTSVVCVFDNPNDDFPGEVGIREIEVQEIGRNELVEDDLKVVFPEGTQVNDMFRQVVYTEGDAGSEIPWQPGSRAAERQLQGQLPSSWRRLLTWGGLLIIPLLALVMLLRLRRERSRA